MSSDRSGLVKQRIIELGFAPNALQSGLSHAAVAQWIEYWPPKPRVVGSIPASRTNYAQVPDSHDFLVMIVACELDKTFALKRTAIAALVPKIAQEFAGPRPVAKSPKLFLTACPPMARYLDGETNIAQGFVLSLTDISSRVNEHVFQVKSDTSTRPSQRSFGPSLIQKKK